MNKHLQRLGLTGCEILIGRTEGEIHHTHCCSQCVVASELSIWSDDREVD